MNGRWMNRRVLAAAALGAAAVTTGVIAAERGGDGPRGDGPRWGMMERFTAEDRAAFTEARIAALRVGLRLTPEQEKLWPPVEDALKNMARLRREQGQARRDQRQSMRGQDGLPGDIPGALRSMADAQGARSDALRRLADASTPLYASLDDAQKRRLLVLARPMGGHGGRHGGDPRR
ncbi:MAG TPA: Spy/CpxP family protein refolding chaperone [Beijerinckiaceae bacterium]|jgi:zinc resistance-associated protein